MAFEYVVDGKKVSLPIAHDKIAVRFCEPSDQAARRAVIDQKSEEVGDYDNRYEVPNEKLTIVDVAQTGRPTPSRVAAATGVLNADLAVERVAPVFKLGMNHAIATDRIIVGFKSKTGEKTKEIIKHYGGEVVKEKFNEYVVRLEPRVDPFAVITDITKHAEVDFAEPDFVIIGKHTPRRPPHAPSDDNKPVGVIAPHALVSHHPTVGLPDEDANALSITSYQMSAVGVRGANAISITSYQMSAVGVQPAIAAHDPLQEFQYAVRITKAVEAWERVTPSPKIKIAILDEGVDAAHPDLRAAICGSFDAVDGDCDQQPNPWDAHGTACAGLAAAIPNNAQGIRGIAGGCSLLAVRIAFSKSEGEDWVTGDSQISDAIDWAWQNGADILSNSWGGGPPSRAIDLAFERARSLGRNGKGCVIVVAAGNDAGPVDFPGTLPNVLTVAASNEFDEPKTLTSDDGEFWWGSNFGPEVDIAAPGVNNYTTDISGDAGYNDGGSLDSNYYSNFNGTSSATPIVAGVAALVLSANPDLKEDQVREVLKQTADKVGGIIYINNRNDQMGHGRVNALKAVEMMLPHLQT
jgi:thermitase